MIFARAKQINLHPGNPQYFAGEAPGGLSGIIQGPGHPPSATNQEINYKKFHSTLNSGFASTATDSAMRYGYRKQPDVGGALDFAFLNYQLPLDNQCGWWMVARHPTRPIGSVPLAFFQMAPVTSIGGLIPGQVISQPLLDPNGYGSGYDIYS